MPHLRFVLRNVHRKLHELLNGSPRHGPCRQWYNSGGLFRQNRACQTCGYAGNGACPEKHPPERHYDRGGIQKCTHRRHGAWMFHKQYAPPAGNRQRVRYCPEPGHGKRNQRKNAEPLPLSPCRKHLHGRLRRGRRRLCGAF